MGNRDYDVALSFAGEDREYVEKVAEILTELNIKVFYDKAEQENLWGKDLYTYLDDIYQNKAKYCVMFISKYYKEKKWTNHERMSSQARAFNDNEEYILPAKFDDTNIPGIRETLGYIDLRDKKPEDLALIIYKKFNPNFHIEELISYLKRYLDYDIKVKGRNLSFYSEIEDYYAEFPLSLMINMYKMDLLYEMFIGPSIVPN